MLFFVYIYQQNWFLRPCTVCLSNHKSILNYSRSLSVTTRMTIMLTADRFVLRVRSLVQITFQDGHNQLSIQGLISMKFVRDIWRFSTGESLQNSVLEIEFNYRHNCKSNETTVNFFILINNQQNIKE